MSADKPAATLPPLQRFANKKIPHPLPVNTILKECPRDESLKNLLGLEYEEGEGAVGVYITYDYADRANVIPIKDWRNMDFKALKPVKYSAVPPKPPSLFTVPRNLHLHFLRGTDVNLPIASRPPAPATEDPIVLAFLDRKKCMQLWIHRIAQGFFVQHETVNEDRFREAVQLCNEIFGSSDVTLEQLQTFGLNQRSLFEEGHVKDFYLKHPNVGLNSVNIRELDRLSFLCAFSSTQYPQHWLRNTGTSIFEGAIESQGEEYAKMGKLIVQALCKGPWVQRENVPRDPFQELPGLNDLENFEIRAPDTGKSKSPSGSITKTSKVLPLDDKTGPASVTIQAAGQDAVAQTLRLGKVASLLARMPLTQVDQIVTRFKAPIPSRGPHKRVFSSAQQLEREAKRANKSTRPGARSHGKKHKRAGFEAGFSEASQAMQKGVDLLLSKMSKTALLQVCPTVLGQDLSKEQLQFNIEQLQVVFREGMAAQLAQTRNDSSFWKEVCDADDGMKEGSSDGEEA